MSWNLDAETFTALVADAARAPSMHNTQPWRFRWTQDAIDVRLDPDRVLPVGDPSGRAARVACGAAVYNLRLALAVRGTPATVRLRPDRHDDLLLARLTPAPPRPATPRETRLQAAIPRRHSNRYPFAETPVPLAVRGDLIQAAREEGGWLDLLASPAAVATAAEMTKAADDILIRNPAYVAELRAWTRGAGAPDGVTDAAGGPAPRPYELLVRRGFGGAETTRDYEPDPQVGVLGAFGDSPSDEVQAGVALQRVLLTATDLGLATSMFTQAIDVPSVREQLRRALGRFHPPQILLRFGYAVSVAETPRRATADVIEPVLPLPAE